LLSFTVADAGAATKRGKVVRVVDGDSVRVKVGKRARTYGLLGVSAPARQDCFGREARRRLKRLLPRRARVRLVTERGAGRRLAYVFRGRRLVNAAVLASGHARAHDLGGLRLGDRLETAHARAQDRGRGMWRACGDEAAPPPTPPPTTPPPTTPPPDAKQQAIAEIDRLLQGVRVYTVKTENGVTDEMTADLCPDHRFLFVLRTSFGDGGAIPPTQTTGTWKVVDALIDPASGVRQAIVETLADGGGEPVRTFLQVNADLASGRWDGQAAGFSVSDQCG
jgi:endonuclease YncB( thermonuclease family)